MFIAKTLLLASLVGTGLATPTIAAPEKPTAAEQCLAPGAFLTALSSAGDWVVKRDPGGVGDEKVSGVVFREGGLIDVAIFRDGCLALVVVVGKAPPDIEV